MFPGKDTETAGSKTIKGLILDRLVNGVLGNNLEVSHDHPFISSLVGLEKESAVGQN